MNELVKGLSQNNVVTYPHAFFKWVYANPCPSLVGIRRIPAYHVDYTTGFNANMQKYNEFYVFKRSVFSSYLIKIQLISKTEILLQYAFVKKTFL